MTEARESTPRRIDGDRRGDPLEIAAVVVLRAELPAAPRAPALETERLRLRRWRPADREPFAALNADPRVMQHLPGVLAREASDALADRIEAGFERHGFGLWAVEVKGAALAFAFGSLRLAEVVSFSAPANRPSRRVMEKIGMRRDELGDFDHPLLPAGHPLRRHVLYRVGPC